jgi:hypothetical protein
VALTSTVAWAQENPQIAPEARNAVEAMGKTLASGASPFMSRPSASTPTRMVSLKEAGSSQRKFAQRKQSWPFSLERKDAPPVVLHIDNRPTLRIGLIERCVELPDGWGAIISKFSNCVIAVDEESEARTRPVAVHCSISRSPSELPNAAIGRRPINFWMVAGFSTLSFQEAKGSSVPTPSPCDCGTLSSYSSVYPAVTRKRVTCCPGSERSKQSRACFALTGAAHTVRQFACEPLCLPDEARLQVCRGDLHAKIAVLDHTRPEITHQCQH